MAEKWLKEFQKSVHAWEVADQCLHQQPNTEACFFAAQTIKIKVQLHFRKELPQQAQEGLRGSLLENLKLYANKNQHAITKQLAVAVADLAIQMFPQWARPVNDLILMLGQSQEHTTRGSLLEVLMVMPEEVHNTFLPLSHEDRKAVSFQMGMDSTILYPFMTQCWNTYSINTAQFMPILEKLFKCLASWLYFGGQGAVDVEAGPLLPAAMQALKSDSSELIDLGCKVISNAMWLAKKVQHHPKLAEFLIPEVLLLQPLLEKAFAEEDIDFGSKLVLLFCELADNLVGVMVNALLMRQQDNQQLTLLLQILIKCVQQTDVDMFLITFNFWYDMAEAVNDHTYERRREYRHLKNRCRTEPNQIPARDALKAELKQLYQPFVPIYLIVYEAISFHMKCPVDLTTKLKSSSDLVDFRERALTMIEETCFLMGADETMAFLWNRCKAGANSGWIGVEAHLYMMLPLVETVTNNSVAMEVLEALTGIGPESHPMLYHTVLKLSGQLSRWARGNAKAIKLIWDILGKAITARKHMQATIAGMKELCRECRSDVAPYLVDLIKLCVAADSLDIDGEDTLVLLEGAVRVIAHLPTEHITTAAEMITKPLLAGIQQMTAAGTAPITLLDRLAVLFKYCNIPGVEQAPAHHLLNPASQTWIALQGVNTKFMTEKKVIEMSNRTLKHMVRNLNKHGAPLVMSIIQHTIQLFQAHKHSSCLYVATGIIKAFGNLDEFAEGMLSMYRTLTTPTFVLLSAPKALIHHPDIVDDYFHMSIAILDCRPHMIMLTELAEPCLQLGVMSMLLQHRDAYDMAVSFMIKFIGVPISQYTRKEHKEQIKATIIQLLMKHGQSLVNNLIIGATGELKSHLLPDIAAVFFELQYLMLEQTHAWVTAAMHMDRVKNSRATQQQLQQFTNGFQKKYKQLFDFKEDVVKPFGRIFERYETDDDKKDNDDKDRN